MAFDLSQHMSTSKLIRFTLPTIFMMIFTSLYTIVDGIFVSNFAGKTAFAAVNFILPFCMILASVGMMIGTGGSAIVAKTLGEGDHPRARRYFTLLVIFAGVIGTALAVMGIFFMEDMSGFLGAEGAMLEAATLYGIFMMFSLPFFVLQYAFQSFFVTAGQPKLGFYVIVIAGVTNIVLDFLFVGVFQWGLIGAAIATNIGEVLGGGIPLIYFMKKRASHLYFVKPHLRLKVIGKACVNGSSEMVTNIAMSFVSMLYNWQLLHYIGEDGVAAYGVIMYTAMIFAAIFMGYSVGASPLMSFQYGAKNHKEMRSLLMKSLGLITIASLFMFLAGQAFAEPISKIFVAYDTSLLDLTVYAYKIYALCFLFMGFSIYASSLFTALNNGLVSALISFLRTLVFETGAVIILPLIFGIDGIWFSVTVAEMFACAIAACFMIGLSGHYGYRKQKKLPAENPLPPQP